MHTLDPIDKWCKRFVLFVGIPFAICFALGWPPSVFGQEVPKFKRVQVSDEVWITVRVFEKECFQGRSGAYADISQKDFPVVYLCGHANDESHELDHWRGMTHTAWVYTQERVACARIILAGYATPYKIGDTICMTNDTRFMWIER